MDQRPGVSLEKSAKPSRLLALIALVIAFALPFILVKSFPHKQKTGYGRTQQPLPLLEVENQIPVKLSAGAKEEFALPLIQLPVKITHPAAAPKAEIAHETPAGVSPPHPPPPVKPLPPPRVVKTPARTPERASEWKYIKTRRGDSFAAVFKRVGLSSQTLQAITRETSRNRSLLKLKPGQQLKFLIKKQALEKVIVPCSSTKYVLVYREGQHYRSKLVSRKTETRNHFVTATVRGSLYTTAKRRNIPYKLVQQMTEIFTWDINFARDVRSGDQFTIIYRATYIGHKQTGTGDIVAVSYKTRGKTFQAARHTTRSGHSDYFSPKGTSLRKAFSRYPLRFSHISSVFSLSRFHSILHYKRPHKGIDLAAPIGTPILATGDGHIEIIGRQSGYGNMIKIKHDKNHSTIYGHILKFQKGLSRGESCKTRSGHWLCRANWFGNGAPLSL